MALIFYNSDGRRKWPANGLTPPRTEAEKQSYERNYFGVPDVPVARAQRATLSDVDLRLQQAVAHGEAVDSRRRSSGLVYTPTASGGVIRPVAQPEFTDADAACDEVKSYHEAGHAAVAEFFSNPIRLVTIDSDHEFIAVTRHFESSNNPNVLERLTLSVAGGVAEGLRFGETVTNNDPADCTKALVAAGVPIAKVGELTSEAMRTAFRVLRQNWQQVIEIAEALKVRRTLDAAWFGPENERLFNEQLEIRKTLGIRRVNMPLQTRSGSASFDAARNTIEICWSSGAPVKRQAYDGPYWEVLEMGASNVRLDFFSSGKAPFLNSHRAGDTQDVLGNIVAGSVYLRDGKGYAQVQLSTRASAAETITDIKSGVLRNVSIGYRYHQVIEEKAGADGFPIMRVVDFEPLECSCVAVPADQQAEIRSFPCDVVGAK